MPCGYLAAIRAGDGVYARHGCSCRAFLDLFVDAVKPALERLDIAKDRTQLLRRQ